jgi:hypothetical protein
MSALDQIAAGLLAVGGGRRGVVPPHDEAVEIKL